MGEFIWRDLLPWIGLAFLVATVLMLAFLAWAAFLLKVRERKQTVQHPRHLRQECDALLTGVKHMLNKTQSKG